MKIKEIPTREELYLEVPRGGIGAELGVCKGHNATQLYFRTRPSHLFLIDIWTDEGFIGSAPPELWYGDHFEMVSNIFSEEIKNQTVTLCRENTMAFLGGLHDQFLDWIYIDSNHFYDYASQELQLCLKKVKRGGYIMGHDFFVEKYAQRSGIIRAVIEQIQEDRLTMEAITLEKWPSYLCKVL